MDGHKAMIYYEQTGDEEEADLLELVDAKEVAWKDGIGPTGEKVAGRSGPGAAREPIKVCVGGGGAVNTQHNFVQTQTRP